MEYLGHSWASLRERQVRGRRGASSPYRAAAGLDGASLFVPQGFASFSWVAGRGPRPTWKELVRGGVSPGPPELGRGGVGGAGLPREGLAGPPRENGPVMLPSLLYFAATAA